MEFLKFSKRKLGLNLKSREICDIKTNKAGSNPTRGVFTFTIDFFFPNSILFSSAKKREEGER